MPRVFRYAIRAAIAIALAVTPRWILQAAPTDLFISEYIEGSSNNKALELYNGTGAAIDLSSGGYQIRMFFNGATTAGTTVNLIGTIPAGGTFVLAQAQAVAAITSVANQTNNASWYNGDDAVLLVKGGGAVVDAIGVVGTDPGAEWGTGSTSTADNTIRRKSTVCAGDPNETNAFDPAGEWDGFAIDTFGGLGSHTVSCGAPSDTAAPTVTSTDPGNGGQVALAANLTLTFSEPVTVSGAWFTLNCSVTGPKAAAVSGGPEVFTLNPANDFAAGENCILTIVAAQVSDQDTLDPPDNMAANFVVTFTAADVCSLPFTRIPAIQGTGLSAAISGAVTTRGVVIGDFELPAGGGIRGFFIQDEDPNGDGNAASSDGIFVFNGNNNSVSLGDIVRVTGTAGEFENQTQISNASIVVCGSGGTIAPVDVELPVASATYLERFEGMLVRLPQTLYVTEHFQLGRFGQVVVSSGERLRQPTNVADPGGPANSLQASNNLNRLIIDDDNNVQNPDPIVFGRNGAPLSASNTLRGGDTATGIVGVLVYTWAGNDASPNAYRVRPVRALGGTVTFLGSNPRPEAAPTPAGSLRVAGMNLLNFFNTFGTTACRFGVGGDVAECRGAGDAAEFDRQWPKTVEAIRGTLADVVGVIEIENDGYGPSSAIQDLVAKLNSQATPGGPYAFIDADAATGQLNALGTDAIKVGLIYKTARVVPVGQTAALNSVAFVNGGDGFPRTRPALAQAFEEVATGGRLIAVVNHFKSKGSACDAPDAGDGQGNCNAVRIRAAQELVAWLATDPTHTGDADVLILGDLNSYAKEDPVKIVEAAGFTNLTSADDSAYSYAFDGQWGSLDHGLASASLLSQVAAAVDWHINSDEPSVLDYNVDFKSAGQITSLYAGDEFRVADHDPVLVDLRLIPALPTVDRGGFVFDRRTGRFTQQVILRNDGTAPIAGPIHLVIDGLSSNATLVNANGLTATVPPLGSPYITVVGAASSLAPGASASVVLQFVNPTRAAITYELRILRAGTP